MTRIQSINDTAKQAATKLSDAEFAALKNLAATLTESCPNVDVLESPDIIVNKELQREVSENKAKGVITENIVKLTERR